MVMKGISIPVLYILVVMPSSSQCCATKRSYTTRFSLCNSFSMFYLRLWNHTIVCIHSSRGLELASFSPSFPKKRVSTFKRKRFLRVFSSTFRLSGKKIASTVIYVKPAVERSTSIISTHVNKKPRRKQQQTKHQPNE